MVWRGHDCIYFPGTREQERGPGTSGGEGPLGEPLATRDTPRRLPGACVLGSPEVRDTSPPTRETHHMLLEEWGCFPFRTGSGHKKGVPSLCSSAVNWKPANVTSEGRTESTPPPTGLPLIRSGGQEVKSGGRGQADPPCGFGDRPLSLWECLSMVRSFSQFHLKMFVCTAMAVHRARGNITCPDREEAPPAAVSRPSAGPRRGRFSCGSWCREGQALLGRRGPGERPEPHPASPSGAVDW